ncbi:MAG: hypothetical protein Q8M02_07090 [Candidatus Didemnitutus sp.]|nr:hypothetical protein [Candidatus Didemnitutus sp.]
MTETSVAALDPRWQKQVESARTAFERGNYEYCIELCREVLLAVPGCLPVRKLQRTAQIKQSGPAKGGLASQLGKLSAAPFLLGGMASLGRDPAKAVANAQKMLDGDPRSESGLRLLGQAAMALGWHETAVFAHEALRELLPDEVKNLVALGRAQLAAGRAGPAMEAAERALRVDPVSGPASALMKDASVAQSMKSGRWEDGGDFRSKIKQP